jgi:hypothetical protein
MKLETYPEAFPHDDIVKLYPGVYLLHGSIKMGPGMRMNRNMIILKEAGQLTLINPVRMNDDGLVELEKLGQVTRIMRLGDFHGLDDAFYFERYPCEFWAQAGQTTYPLPKPTHLISADTESPITNSAFFVFNTSLYPEAALLLRDHKLLITTDSVQYHADWSYFTGFTKFAFKLLGFKQGINIGPPWLKRVTPKGGSLKTDFEQLLALDFDALVAAHGLLMASGAKAALEVEVQKRFSHG